MDVGTGLGAVLLKGAAAEELALHTGDVSATGRRAAWALLAEGGLVPSRALAAVAEAGPTEAAHVSAGVEAVLRGLLALAGTALIPRLALARPAVAFPTCWAAAEGAVEELAVHVVTLAEGAVDVLARHVAGVAHALPAHAVPLPRADHRAVVPAAAALQLLAALPFGVALALLPCVP